MKNLANMISYALIVFLGVFISMSLCSCSNDYGPEKDPQKEEPKNPDPQPDPEKPDTTQWKTVGEKTLKVDENRLVTSTIFGLKHDGTVDSLVLKYMLKFQLSAPDTIRLTQPGTELTAYTGMLSFPGANHERYWEGKDSLCVVTTQKGYKTSYFDVVWETSHTLGWTIIKGQPEPYKWDVESSQAVFNGNSLQRYCEPYEVEKGDSIYLREEIRNVVQMTFHGRTFVEEKKVVVDHFLRMKESEPDQPEEPEHNHPDWWGEPVKLIGQGTFVYRPGVGAKGQGQFYKNINVLFENVLVCVTTKSYVKEDYSPMDFDWDNALVYSLGSTLRGKTITSEYVTDLNSVIWRDGKWEAALCNYDQKNFSWTYMSPDGHDQGMTEHLAETCGLKNFAGKHTARLHPSLFYTASISNGTLVIKDDNGGTIKSFH